MSFQFHSSVRRRESPGDFDAFFVPFFDTGQDLSLDVFEPGETPIQTLPGDGAQFDLGHIEPRRMDGRRMKLEPLFQRPRRRRVIRLRERPRRMRLQVVLHHTSARRLWILRGERLHELRIIGFRSAKTHLGKPDARQRLDGDQQATDAMPLILGILFF